MTPLETGLIAVSTGFLAALITGAGVYVKLGRQILTRDDHERECAKTLDPVRKDITEIKQSCRRLEDKQDDNTKDLGSKIQKVLLLLAKMNGDE